MARLSTSTLDSYLAKQSIERHVSVASRSMLQGVLLDVGCGNSPYRSMLIEPAGSVKRYIGLDLASTQYSTGGIDVFWDGHRIPLRDQSVDCALATEVFEHCPAVDEVMVEIQRVLKPGGVLVFTVPFLWPLHDVPWDECRYTPFSLQRRLLAAGFSECTITASGGWDASLAQMLGLWARRRLRRNFMRTAVSWAILPVYWMLLKAERGPCGFGESQMITGLCGHARKPAGDGA